MRILKSLSLFAVIVTLATSCGDIAIWKEASEFEVSANMPTAAQDTVHFNAGDEVNFTVKTNVKWVGVIDKKFDYTIVLEKDGKLFKELTVEANLATNAKRSNTTSIVGFSTSNVNATSETFAITEAGDYFIKAKASVSNMTIEEVNQYLEKVNSKKKPGKKDEVQAVKKARISPEGKFEVLEVKDNKEKVLVSTKGIGTSIVSSKKVIVNRLEHKQDDK